MSAPNRLCDDEDTHEDYAVEARMGFLEHLDELRSRLIRACIALVAGMAVSFVFALRLGDLLLAEILASLPRESSLIYSRPGEGFAFYLDLSLMGGLILVLLGIVIAWLRQRTPNETASGGAALRLVFAAGLVEGARRRTATTGSRGPRLVPSRK